MPIHHEQHPDVLYQDDFAQKEPLKIPEIRVWCHHEDGRDDTFVKFQTFEEACKFINDNLTNEKFYPENAPVVAYNGLEFNFLAK